MKKILITGAAGFLGSHLSDRFIKEGYHVIGMDNLLTGSMDNIAHLMPREDFTFYHHDVSKFVHVPGELDYILHFASPASPIDYLKMPIQTLKVGSLGTHNLLGLAKAKNARMLIASTSEVYGDPLVNPQPEEYWGNVNPVGPRGVYDEAKRDGSQTRAFCYVDDLVEGIYRLLFSEYALPVNIGNPDEISILQAAEEVLDLVEGTTSSIVFKGLPKDDPKVRRPDITKAKELLDWQPTVDRAEGLRRTYEYFKTKI